MEPARFGIYKRPAFWILIAVIACVIVAVCCLAGRAKPPIEFGGIQITWAKTLDMRPNEPTSRDLNGAQLDELKSRLRDLKIGRKDSDFGGLTPLYSLSMQAQGHPQFMIAGYTADGSHMALLVQDQYYRLDDPDFARYLRAVCAGEDTAAAEKRLTLDDVLLLSQKGEALTWADLDGFSHIETGSGLYIRVYEIDELFSLMIGGPEPAQKPWYVRLVSTGDHDDSIDIRTEDAERFIQARQARSAKTVYASTACVYMSPLSSYWGGGDSGLLYTFDHAGDGCTISITDKATGEPRDTLHWNGEWAQLSPDEWTALFVMPDHSPDISGFGKPLFAKLSDAYFLFNMDGALWIGKYNGEKVGMWSVYALG